MTAFACISRLWHLFGLDHCKSCCIHSHLGESEGQDRVIITCSRSLFCHIVHGGKVVAERMWWKKWYNRGGTAGCAWRSLHLWVFFLSKLNFSAVAVCPLCFLKDFHISSCNSMSFKIAFFLSSCLCQVCWWYPENFYSSPVKGGNVQATTALAFVQLLPSSRKKSKGVYVNYT